MLNVFQYYSDSMAFIMESLQTQNVDEDVGYRLAWILLMVPRRTMRELFTLLKEKPNLLPTFSQAFDVCRPCLNLRIHADGDNNENSILCSTYILKQMLDETLDNGGDLEAFGVLLRQLSQSTVTFVGKFPSYERNHHDV